jgi:DNA-binding PadR family transcriptional regulator
MRPLVRMTLTTRLVLGALRDGPTYAYAIVKETGLRTGTVVPILHRLEEHGWVAGEWETPRPEGRPARRYYRLTDYALGFADLYGRPEGSGGGNDTPRLAMGRSRR